MNIDFYKDKTFNLIKPYLADNGLDLVDFKIFFQDGGIKILVVIDEFGGGISIEKCAQINREICKRLETENIISGSFVLEVCSPGLDRPLTTEADFRRAKGKNLDVYLSKRVEERLQYTGKLIEVDSYGIYISCGDQTFNLKYQDINKAKQKI